MNSDLHPSMVCEPSNGTVADISALLRASRIRRGEGLRDVADQLRIRFVHLEAIEDGRFDELPATPMLSVSSGPMPSISAWTAKKLFAVLNRWK